MFDSRTAQLAVLTSAGVLILAAPSGDLRHRLGVVPRRRQWNLGYGCVVAFSSKGDRIAVVSTAEAGPHPVAGVRLRAVKSI